MDLHGIQTSVVSLANPWLDFLSGQESDRPVGIYMGRLKQFTHSLTNMKENGIKVVTIFITFTESFFIETAYGLKEFFNHWDILISYWDHLTYKNTEKSSINHQTIKYCRSY